MTIPAAAKATPLPKPEGLVAFADPDGSLSSHALQLLNEWRNFIVGMNRITPCSASGTNVITLTPNDSSPLHPKYIDHEAFAFVAANNSTGSVTMLVAASRGNLSTLKAYKTNGSAQAGAGDITAGLYYVAYYVSSMDSGAGGFVLK